MNKAKELWKKYIKNEPHFVARMFVLLTILFLICLYFITMYYDVEKSHISDVAAISGLLVLILSVVGFVYNHASLGQLRNEIIGTHEIFDTFPEHIDKLLRKVKYTGHGKLIDMTLVISSLAYGLQSGNSENVKNFFRIINIYLDDIEKDTNSDINKHLSLYIWEQESHKKIFALKEEEKNENGVNTETSNIICIELKKLLKKIKKLTIDDASFIIKVQTTQELDWRLFSYRKVDENFGMTVLFTPFAKESIKEKKWGMSSYSSNSTGVLKHYNNFLMNLDKSVVSNITEEFLNIDKFIQDWFDIDCKNYPN